MSIFQTALFLHRFEVHRVQRCNRNFTLAQDNSKSLYPPLSWKVLKMLLLLLQKLFPRPRPSFSSGLLSMLWKTRNNTLNWLYNSLLCRFHWYLSFLIISFVNTCEKEHFLSLRLYLYRRVGHLDYDIQIFIFLRCELETRLGSFYLYRREGHLSDWSWTLCGSTPDYQRSAVLNHLGKSLITLDMI